MTIGIAANLLAIACVIAYVLWRAHPATEAVRLRNALMLQRGSAEDFHWTPPRFPAGFKNERMPPPREFREIVSGLGVCVLRDDWRTALALASHLIGPAQDKGPIRADPLTTYRAIQEGYGYCADFVKVFIALADTAGLTARQWAFSFDGFGGHGHTLIEVFDRQRGRWLFIDVYNNFHAVDPKSSEPLSALEYRKALLAPGEAAFMRPNGPGRLGFVHPEKVLEYYRRGIHQWYLWWGNAIFSYYAHPLVKVAGRLSRTLAHVAASIAGVQPRIRIYETPENARSVHRLFALRRTLLVLAVILGIALTSLAWQLLMGIGR